MDFHFKRSNNLGINTYWDRNILSGYIPRIYGRMVSYMGNINISSYIRINHGRLKNFCPTGINHTACWY
jgi:hypothetical protein